MLKKTIAIFLCLIFALTLLCTDIVYAEQIKITEEEFIKAFEKILENQDEDTSSKISISNNVITITTDDKSIEITYDFTNEPTFTATSEIKSGMTYKQYQDELEKNIAPLGGYMVLLLNEYSKKYGEDSNIDIAFYIMALLLGTSQQIDSHSSYKIVDDLNGETIIQDDSKTKQIKTSEFPDKVMEYVNDTFGKKFTISDLEESGVHSYDLTFEQTNVTNESCNIVSTLVIDTEGFYSVLDKLNEESKEEKKDEENADYKVALKVGQKCNIESNYKSSGYLVTSSSGKIEFSEDYKEFTAIKEGNVYVTLYFKDSNNNEITKSIYVTIEENTNNETLNPVTLKIEGGSPQENNDKDNNNGNSNNNNTNNSTNNNLNNNTNNNINNLNNNTSDKKINDGTANIPIPKTGVNNIIFTLFIVFIICTIIGLIKLNKYKDIK